MKWRAQTVENGRLEFIQKALASNGRLTFAELCLEYSISRKTGYKWLNRFLASGELGLSDRPKKRHSQDTKLDVDVKQNIIKIRTKFPNWGPKKIQAELLDQKLITPSQSSIGNVLKEYNLSKPRNFRRHVAKTAPLSDCHAPNDVWMYDFKGYFKVGDGKICEPLTITDGFSRYLICCKHMKRKRACDVWDVLKEVFKEYGLPLRMRSDNGPPFASVGIGRLSSLAIKLIKVGIMPEWIEPGKPQENGRHERFHLTLKQEIANPPAATLSLQIARMDQFAGYFNNDRHHEALNQSTPKLYYHPSDRKWDGDLKSPTYTEEFEVRSVCKGGNIGWKGSTYFLSESLYGEPVGLKQSHNFTEVHYGPILLGRIDYTKGFKRI